MTAKRVLFSVVGMVAVAVAAVGVSATGNPPKHAPAHPNVILITIDTVRADHLGCYGYKQIQTPTIDALARDGIAFKHAISQVPLTWPSHTAILTGSYPFQNGVQDFTGQPLSPQFRSIAQAFQNAGYSTGAIVSSFVLDRSWGLARGFDFYDDAFSAETFKEKDIGLVDRKAGESITHALNWLKRTPKRPFFLWLHLYDPHSPYDPPEPFRTEYRDHLYDGEIAYTDHELSRLISYLKGSGAYDRSLIVLLSDHGESLGEHGESEHGFFVYNSTIHIPLIVKPPARSRIPRDQADRPVETIAVAPTLLKLAGIHDKVEAQFQGKSLFEGSDTIGAAAYSETFYPFSSFGWSPLHSLETSRYHYVEAPQAELYDLRNDPAETTNIAAQQPATISVLKEKLQQVLTHKPFSRDSSTAAGLDPDAEQKLRALGYFAFRSPVSAERLKQGLADPKDKISEFNTILKAEDAFHQGDAEQAEGFLRQVQKEDPNIYVIPYMLGESHLRRGNWQLAAEELQRCLRLNPDFDNAMTGLARALSKLGRVDEAKAWLQKAVQLNPENYRAWYETGLLEATSNPAAALADYQKAITIQPNYSPGQRELGMALYQARDYAAAASHFEKALALGLDDAHLRNFLGICYSQTNRPQKSIASYEAALKLDPSLAEAHLNFAYELRRLGRLKEARAESATACQLQTKFCGLIQ